MATVRYTVLDGEMIAEKRSGTRRYYSHDAQGHTVALYDGSQTKTDTFTYWPYGEIRTPSGSTPTKYKYLGAWSCRTQIDGSVKTVRTRELECKDGRFRNVDPLWPNLPNYLYAHSSPSSQFDASGYIVAVTVAALLYPPEPKHHFRCPLPCEPSDIDECLSYAFGVGAPKCLYPQGVCFRDPKDFGTWDANACYDCCSAIAALDPECDILAQECVDRCRNTTLALWLFVGTDAINVIPIAPGKKGLKEIAPITWGNLPPTPKPKPGSLRVKLGRL